jgi:hypothetical protein
MTFNQDDRALLAQLADVLIPASATMPSASQADVAGRQLDLVLTARPDLAASLRGLLDQARGCDAAQFVAAQRRANSPAFGVLAELVPAAYFTNEHVCRLIGYGGQTAQSIDERPDYLDDGLLDSVIARGPIYRPTPAK